MKIVQTASVWAIVLLLTLCSCATREKREGSLAWEKLADDWGAPGSYRYENATPRMIVISNRDSLSSLQNQLRPAHFELVANIDFSTHLVITIYQGKKGSTGYSIDVTDVQRKDNTITIYAQFHEPAPDALTNPLITSPYYILKVEKAESIKGEFTFVLVADGIEIVRQEHVIP